MKLPSIVKRLLVALTALLVLGAALFTLGVIWPLHPMSPVSTTTPIALERISIVDVDAGVVLPMQTILIDRGRIAEAGPADTITPPPTAMLVDGRGLYVLPALWDMHAHVYAVSPLLELPLYIAYGVTNVRDMQGCPKPDDPFIACADDKRRWTEEALGGARVAPRIAASTSFMANGPSTLERIKGVPPFFGTATAEEARQFVRHFSREVDAIKVYDRIPRDAYLALVDEARRFGIDVVGHRPHGVSAIEAARHQKSIEHARVFLHESFPGASRLRELAGTPDWREDRRRMLDEHDPEMAQAIFAEMKRNGTWYVPTHLTRWVDAYADDHVVLSDPGLRYLHPLMKWQWLEDVNATVSRDPSPPARATYREFYEKGLELTGEAHEAGVRVLVGSDYIVAGVDVHREMQQLVKAGLTSADALRAATLNPAEYFGLTEEYGDISAEKRADLLLLRENPLDEISNTLEIEAVIFNGNLYDRDALNRIEDHVEARARSWSVACKILWRFIRNPVSY